MEPTGKKSSCSWAIEGGYSTKHGRRRAGSRNRERERERVKDKKQGKRKTRGGRREHEKGKHLKEKDL